MDIQLAVKDDQPTLHAEIESYFDTAPHDELATAETLDKAHGRMEVHNHKVSRTTDWVNDERVFPGAKRCKNLAAIAVVQTRIEKGDKVSNRAALLHLVAFPLGRGLRPRGSQPLGGASQGTPPAKRDGVAGAGHRE